MTAPTEKPLACKRILIPPARPEANPLLNILERRGAEVLEFPSLKVVPPGDYGPIDRAIRRLKDFDCIVFSGSNCVINFLDRLEALRLGKAALSEPKIVPIGHGTVSVLKREGIEIHYIPNVHTAEGVTERLGDIYGLNFLLVRMEGASRSLPQRLRDLGAQLSEVVGYRMLVVATLEMAESAFALRIDGLALANPTSVRFLFKGVEQLGLNLADSFEEVTIAAVGPATAAAAGTYGLTPNIVSKGHIADLAESLTNFFAKVQQPRRVL